VRARELRSVSTDAERRLWSALRDRRLNGHKFRRQHPLGSYFADFVCIEAKLVIELDGGQHFEPDAMAADGRRTKALNDLGFSVLRFTNREVMAEFDAVLNSIRQWFDERAHPHPNPLPLAGEGVALEDLYE
jgi:adenine-specific DNA-methyltransferase